MAQWKNWKERYLALKSKGICVRCGQKKSVTDKTCCVVCLKKHLQTDHEWRARTLAKGLCKECGKYPHSPTSQRCALCSQAALVYKRNNTSEQLRVKLRKKMKVRRKVFKKEGKCACGRSLFASIYGNFKCCYMCRHPAERAKRGMLKVTNQIYINKLRTILKEESRNAKIKSDTL